MDTGESTAGETDLPAAAALATDRRLEIQVAIVLAVSGLASAWASYQGGIWDKRGSEKFAIANAQLTESSQLLIRSGQEQAVCAALFLQWLDAESDRQALRADVIANHMPPWCSTEFARWRSELPDDLATLKPNSPLPAFAGPSKAAARSAREKSNAAQQEGEAAGHVGDAYGVANVVLATALFLAGIASILHNPRGRRLVVSFAGLLTLGALVGLAMTGARAAG